MRGGSGRLACLLGALMTLSLCASAQAGERIVGGSPASAGEYPAQGAFIRNSDNEQICGGTLLSNRYFITAAHCVTNLTNGAIQPTGNYSVRFGSLDRDGDGQLFGFSDKVVKPGWDYQEFDNDAVLFTLSTLVPPGLAEPLRLIEDGEGQPVGAGKAGHADRLGGSFTGQKFGSEALLEATAPMRSDEDCGADSAYWSEFHPATMVCAGNGSSDTCQGDSGGPMMVSDGSFLVLAGADVVGHGCATPTSPASTPGSAAPSSTGGSEAACRWLARASRSQRRPVRRSCSRSPPRIPGFRRSRTSPGVRLGRCTEAQVEPHAAYPAGGNYVARVTASGTAPDTAVAKVAVNVAQPPAVITPGADSPIVTAAPTPATEPGPRTGLATILTLKQPQVRGGRFKMRINFRKNAPSGNAFVEVFRKKKKIGSVRARVRPGGTRRSASS